MELSPTELQVQQKNKNINYRNHEPTTHTMLKKF